MKGLDFTTTLYYALADVSSQIATVIIVTLTIAVLPTLSILVCAMPKERPVLIKALRVSLLLCGISFLYYGMIMLIHPWIQCSSKCYAYRSAQLYFNFGTIIIGLVLLLSYINPKIYCNPHLRVFSILILVLALVAGTISTSEYLKFPHVGHGSTFLFWIFAAARHIVPLFAFVVLSMFWKSQRSLEDVVELHCHDE